MFDFSGLESNDPQERYYEKNIGKLKEGFLFSTKDKKHKEKDRKKENKCDWFYDLEVL